ncbi:DUF2934 domain-containing protein [Methylobacterium iners]|uniref:DUF2934 domain-containing protein n=1 Tax=Methylobacterium iners TaxID=418707 RepID=A0ABQ4RY57_9HYPH|nr:DUF2934 domain-containing protein [Methylobacterium iners]GJD94512.1 hypothetical protein OCOJLMKI_1714 [Methylobacterium iners]
MSPPAESPLDQIRGRAYELWERNHRPEVFEIEFWLTAERELRAERSRKLQSSAADEAASAHPRSSAADQALVKVQNDEPAGESFSRHTEAKRANGLTPSSKPKSPKLSAEKLTPEEQKRRFIQAARDAGASEDEAEFDGNLKRATKARVVAASK